MLRTALLSLLLSVAACGKDDCDARFPPQAYSNDAVVPMGWTPGSVHGADECRTACQHAGCLTDGICKWESCTVNGDGTLLRCTGTYTQCSGYVTSALPVPTIAP